MISWDSYYGPGQEMCSHDYNSDYCPFCSPTPTSQRLLDQLGNYQKANVELRKMYNEKYGQYEAQKVINHKLRADVFALENEKKRVEKESQLSTWDFHYFTKNGFIACEASQWAKMRYLYRVKDKLFGHLVAALANVIIGSILQVVHLSGTFNFIIAIIFGALAYRQVQIARNVDASYLKLSGHNDIKYVEEEVA